MAVQNHLERNQPSVASGPTLVVGLVLSGSLHTNSNRLGILVGNHILEIDGSGSGHLLGSTLSEQ